MESRHVERAIIAAFAAVVLSFVSATWLSERHGGYVERAALSIHGKAAPSIRRLATAKTELRRVQLLVRRSVERDSDPSAALGINTGRELLEQELAAYKVLPSYPGEEATWQRAKGAVGRLDDILSQIVAALAHRDLESARQLESRLDVASDELARFLSQDIEVNAAAAARLAAEIQTSRRRGIILAVVLDGLGILLAIVAATWSLRVARAHARAVHALREMAERRAEELDRFAGRMAHDVRTPLAAVGLSLSLADRHGGDDPRFRRAIKRATGGFQQAELIIDALFDFARAGACPDPGARTSVADAAEQVAANMSTRAEQVGADVAIRVTSGAVVACAAGLVETAIANLVNNALTYVDGRDNRQVTIDITDDGLAVDVRVSDTGPGLLAGTDSVAIFEPHVRGAQARGRGLGLGLATVKKIVDAHGGRVGVNSSPDGCVFWFTLPVASTTIPAPVGAQASTGDSAHA
jgi:signal transduction histidine kinase